MHVNFVCDSLVKFCGIFNHIKHKVTQQVVRQLFYGFIYSKIAYGLEVYGYTSVSNVSNIQTMQNKLLRLILKLYIRTRTNTVHNMLNILKIEDRHKTKVLASVNSCVMNKCPAIFEQYYNIKNIQYYTRHIVDLDVPPSVTFIFMLMNAAHSANNINHSQNIETILLCHSTRLKKRQNWYVMHFNVESYSRWNGLCIHPD